MSDVPHYKKLIILFQILRTSPGPVSKEVLIEKLSCSERTFFRLIKQLEDCCKTNIEWDQEGHGYAFSQEAVLELPGFLYSDSELYGLAFSSHLLEEVRPGLLREEIKPIREKIESALEMRGISCEELKKRTKILKIGYRHLPEKIFGEVSKGTFARHKIKVKYHSRSKDELKERLLSPQRFVLYRDNWYLDSWCHLEEGLRLFSLDQIKEVELQEEKAKEVPEEELKEYFALSYGIFAGRPKETAVLRFSHEMARWVEKEQWHPDQISKKDKDYYQLEFPYSNPTELIMDILKYGPHVQVIAPNSLRQQVKEKLEETILLYQNEKKEKSRHH